MKIFIIGAGAAGLSAAFALAREGLHVEMLDSSHAGRGAIWASGGMLAAGYEACVELPPNNPKSSELSKLFGSALDMWSEFAAQIENVSKINIGHRNSGVILPIFGSNNYERLNDVMARATALSIKHKVIDASAIRPLEPSLASCSSAILFPCDGQLDNRALSQALVRAVEKLGVSTIKAQATDLIEHVGQVIGVRTSDGEERSADIVILASGAGRLARELASVDIQPVKGQMVSFATQEAHMPMHVIRALSVYLAPKADRLVIGATSHPGDATLKTDKASIDQLIDKAKQVCPDFDYSTPIESWAGLRPYAPGGNPVIGEVKPGLLALLGGYRNGVLLAPIMASAIRNLVKHGRTDAVWEPFQPSMN